MSRLRNDPWLLDTIDHLNSALTLLNAHGDPDGLQYEIKPRSAGDSTPTPYGMVAQALDELLALVASPLADKDRHNSARRLGDLISVGGSDLPVADAVRAVNFELAEIDYLAFTDGVLGW